MNKPQHTPPHKLAIVTGGSSGIGFAIAKKLVENHFTVVITGRNEQKLKDAQALLGEACYSLYMDITRLDEIPTHVRDINNRFGKIDVLINNAGVNLKKDLLEVSNEEFQQILLTNLTGVFALSREVAKVMIRYKQGKIINISSMAAHYGLPKVIAYTASKSAIEGMTRAMAVELSPQGILVNCIAPGFIKTSMSSTALDQDPDRRDRVLTRTPLGALGLPEDVANMAYFLVSDESAFITGAILPVDGGNSIGF